MASLKYWLWLTTREGMGHERKFQLLEHFGSPESAYFADPNEYTQVGGLGQYALRSLADKNLDGAERILEHCEMLFTRIVTIGDAEYPDRLKHIPDPPLVLYIKGRVFSFDEELAIGLVGAREPSLYGRTMAGRLGYELARGGALVVSGIAQGLDTEGILGALKGGGPVVSVLGGGVDVIYPRENRYLYQDVAAAGALVSEYPPGTETAGAHFPVRNRIISGLSLGVVAVQCGLQSGTMITINRALAQDRDIFAVPGSVEESLSAGPHKLIREGAVLVTCGADILQEYEGRFAVKMRRPKPLDPEEEAVRLAPKAPRKQPSIPESDKKEVDKAPDRAYIDLKEAPDRFTPDQRDLLLALDEKCLTADDLVELAQIPAKRVLSALTLLQVEGLVTEKAGKRFESTVKLRG